MLKRIFFPIFLCILFSGCSVLESVLPANNSEPAELSETSVRESLDVGVRIPSADGVDVLSSEYVNIDHSNSSKGYVMVEYTGSHTGKIKFRIEDSLGNIYTYDLHGKEGYQTFPLTSGSGTYTLQTFEQSSGTEYYSVDSQTITANIVDEFSPFLYSNQYVDFATSTLAIKEAEELYEYTSTDIEFIENVFFYTMDMIEYDYDKAQQAATGEIAGYLPVLDDTITSGKGICFDYAAVMTAMLRSQNIPTKLVIGYVGDVYHAWISTYTKEKGWIDAIEFDGVEWKLMDPTFADNSGDTTFVGTGENYAEKYVY